MCRYCLLTSHMLQLNYVSNTRQVGRNFQARTKIIYFIIYNGHCPRFLYWSVASNQFWRATPTPDQLNCVMQNATIYIQTYYLCWPNKLFGIKVVKTGTSQLWTCVLTYDLSQPLLQILLRFPICKIMDQNDTYKIEQHMRRRCKEADKHWHHTHLNVQFFHSLLSEKCMVALQSRQS